MRRRTEKNNLLILAVAAVAAIAVAPPSVRAWTSTTHTYHRTIHDSSWDTRDSYNARRMQDDRIAAQEESQREKGREKRRDELEKEREANQAEYLASQAAIREASRAASRAPRDAFYRKPGTTVSSLPTGHVELDVGGTTYFYDRGIFFIAVQEKYIAVAAPAGAMIDKLPDGVRPALYKNDSKTYTYYYGTFFVEENGRFKVVVPPAGTLVGFIPDGYTETGEEGAMTYQFGDTVYRPAFYQGQVVYQVAEG